MGETNPTVSVIVPVYNVEPYLAQCLESLLAQTLADIEVICVDDGSVDGSADVLARFSAEDARVRVIRQDNAGPGVARNTGIDAARGEYLYCFDGDDFCDPELLEEAVACAREHAADVVALPFSLYNEQVGVALPVAWSLVRDRYPQGAFTWRDNPDALFETFHNYPWNKLVRTAFVRENGIRFLDIYLTEDLAYSAAALVRARAIACTDIARIYHREGISTNSMSDKHKHPFDFITAFAELRRYLENEGVFGDLRTSYVRWAANAVSYNLTTLKNEESFVEVFARLASSGLADMALDEAACGLIENEFDAELIRLVRTAEPMDLLFWLYAQSRPEAELATYRSLVEYRISTDLRRERDELARRTADVEARLAIAERDVADLREMYDHLLKLHEETMNAAEQKIGQAVCAIPRAVQRAVLARKEKDASPE